ncbi:MAG: hemolysin family protein [Treponema sp.]|jgi:putative hemolysin|nr:hemolysin family protein [Treponema sp.]
MDEDPLIWQLLLQAALIMVNAVLACAEIALISVNSTRLEKSAASGNRKARRILSLTEKPAHFLATIQVGITLAGFLGSAFAADNFSDKLSAALINAGFRGSIELIGTASLILITLILSFFTLVLGELVPKRIAMRKSQQLAFALSSLVVIISWIFAPVVWLLTRSTNVILRLFGIDPEAEEQAITSEEIRLLVDAGSARGSIAASTKEIIHNVFEFSGKTADEVMTHRKDSHFLWLRESDDEWENTIIETRHNFYPVCAETVDDIRGIISSRDYLALKDRSRESVLASALGPAWFVPNTVETNVLFRKMKAFRRHFAVVVDEYGGMDGIITINDLLEELVGDITEGDDRQESPAIVRLGPALWRISGSASLDRLSRETGILLPEENYDTFGGFVFTLLGRIPNNGERPELEYKDGSTRLKISILEIRKHRLESALLSVL